MNYKKQFNILISITTANMKSRYRDTFYGFIWVILNPILTYLVQVFAFKMIFQGNFPNYSIYLLAGLLPWLFIVQSIDMCTGIFIHSSYLLKNLPIAPYVLPISQMIDNFINFISAFLILLSYFIISGNISILILPFLLLPIMLLFITVTSLSLAFAVINVKYRDLKFVISFIFTALFFLTPIFYSIEIVPYPIRYFIANNPFYLLIRPFQELLLNGYTHLFFQLLLKSIYVTAIIFSIALVFWNKMKRNVTFYA